MFDINKPGQIVLLKPGAGLHRPLGNFKYESLIDNSFYKELDEVTKIAVPFLYLGFDLDERYSKKDPYYYFKFLFGEQIFITSSVINPEDWFEYFSPIKR